MIDNSFTQFYGDNNRWFVGVVVDVMDPKKLGRVKVRAIGVYDDIKVEDLPWAQIVVPITTGIHEGKGQNLGVLVGTNVFGIFLDGQSSQLPLVIGSVPKQGDTNEKALDNYPNNKVYETETGHYKEYDDTEGKRRIKEHHASGTHYEINNEGSRTTVIVENDKLIVKGNLTIEVDGTADIHVKQSASVTSKAMITAMAPDIVLVGNVVKINS